MTHSKRQNVLWGDLANEKVMLIWSVFQGDYKQLLQTNLPKSPGMQMQPFSSALQSSPGLAPSCVHMALGQLKTRHSKLGLTLSS